ncbi:hypothetical protein FQA47_005189 [Oryzias melastigma]|uniref:Uncharacterized protein n=1 Tax=Oryzias melastigma TaxID=30732 RepID=A0A834F7A5_ORYME|nr:hypothetical protein FQA47_005189 [Oryzias melastigma]
MLTRTPQHGSAIELAYFQLRISAPASPQPPAKPKSVRAFKRGHAEPSGEPPGGPRFSVPGRVLLTPRGARPCRVCYAGLALRDPAASFRRDDSSEDGQALSGRTAAVTAPPAEPEAAAEPRAPFQLITSLTGGKRGRLAPYRRRPA